MVSVPGLVSVSAAPFRLTRAPSGPTSWTSPWLSWKVLVLTGVLKVMVAEPGEVSSGFATSMDVTARGWRRVKVPENWSLGWPKELSRVWFIGLPARSRTSGPTSTVYVPGWVSCGRSSRQTVSVPGLALVSVAVVRGTGALLGSRNTTSPWLSLKVLGSTAMLKLNVTEEIPTVTRTGLGGDVVIDDTRRPSTTKPLANVSPAGDTPV